MTAPAKPVSHVTRVRWKWLFGVVFVIYGVYALVHRWIFWQWDSDSKIADLAVEPGALLLGIWLIRAAVQGTRERLSYGAVTVRMNPSPAHPGAPIDLVLLASGVAAGEFVQLALVCQLAEPDGDDVNYTHRWRMEQDVVAQAEAQGIEIRARFELPATAPAQVETGQNYEVLTLHVSHAGGLDREFSLDWRLNG